MINKNLIGLAGIAENEAGERIGSARVGKDEVGKYLKSLGTYQNLSFAAPIYEVAFHAFGLPREVIDNPSHFDKEERVYAPWGVTLREILQTIGTELFRDNVDPNFWVMRSHLEVKRTITRGLIPVFTDVRMPNEANYIREQGGVIIHVHRKTDLGAVRLHRSELQVEILEGDLHLFNNGTLEELHQAVRELLL